MLRCTKAMGLWGVFFALSAFVLSGCLQSENPPSGCSTGKTEDCSCGGGEIGVQTCLDDGMFGSCECAGEGEGEGGILSEGVGVEGRETRKWGSAEEGRRQKRKGK